MSKKLSSWLLIMLLIFFVASFYHAQNSYAAESYVRILKIEPDPSVSLKSGSEVHFKVKVEYKIIEDSATLNLIIQKGEYSGSLDDIVGSTMEVLNKGKGSVILEKTVTIPNTKAIQVFTPLTIPGQTRTTIVDAKYYKVVK